MFTLCGDCRKNVNNFYFYFWELFLFYSISVTFFGSVLLGLCQWSLIPFISRFLLGLCQWPIKASHPYFISIPVFPEIFSKSFQGIFSYIYLEEFIQNSSCTHLVFRVHPRRDLAVESQRQTTGTLVHRVPLRGGWIYFKDSVCHASANKFIFLIILLFVCGFWVSLLFPYP